MKELLKKMLYQLKQNFKKKINDFIDKENVNAENRSLLVIIIFQKMIKMEKRNQ